MSDRKTVEIYWTGRGYTFEGSPVVSADLHEVWKLADGLGLQVTAVKGTPAGHKESVPIPDPATKEDEARYERYLDPTKPPEPIIGVKP